MQPIREPSPIENYSRIPQITVSQTAGYGEDQQREASDSRTSSNKLNLSKSYAHGLSNSAETVRIFIALWNFPNKTKKRSFTRQVIDDVTLSRTDNSLQSIFEIGSCFKWRVSLIIANLA